VKLVYIAGPYAAHNSIGVSGNIQRAREVADQVARLGFFPVTPHLLGVGLEDAGSTDFWYEGTLSLMRRCDAVVLKNSEHSKGTANELADAVARGLPVTYQDDDNGWQQALVLALRPTFTTLAELGTWAGGRPEPAALLAETQLAHSTVVLPKDDIITVEACDETTAKICSITRVPLGFLPSSTRVKRVRESLSSLRISQQQAYALRQSKS